jgi:hypothetical protein
MQKYPPQDEIKTLDRAKIHFHYRKMDAAEGKTCT